MERKRFRGSLVGVGLTFAFLLLTSVAWGQVSGTMSGYVTDNTGALVPSATLTATIEGRGTTFSATSNTEGFYTFTALEPGTYTLSVEKQGFKHYFQKDSECDGAAESARRCVTRAGVGQPIGDGHERCPSRGHDLCHGIRSGE